jgi:ADP-dependent NAD(P)H-hydrate dehydratase
MTYLLPTGQAISEQQIDTLFTPRPPQSHKGTFGSAAILGGSTGMTGAAILAARAALKTGAGKVWVGLTQTPCPIAYDSLNPELMIHEANDLFPLAPDIQAWGAGCGLGRSNDAIQSLRQVFSKRLGVPLVVDADALNALAEGAVAPTWGRGDIVLTPHPAEAARLLGIATQAVQTDRQGAALELARRFQAWVVLKGAQTIVCAPDLSWQVNQTGNAGLATAGSGDVLTGILVSLLAQGLATEVAVPAAVWLHGAAADRLVRLGTGPIGMTAGEITDAARALRNRCR